MCARSVEGHAVPDVGQRTRTDRLLFGHSVGRFLDYGHRVGRELVAGGGGHGNSVGTSTHGNALRGRSRVPQVGSLHIGGGGQRGGIALTDSCFTFNMDVRRNDTGVRYKAQLDLVLETPSTTGIFARISRIIVRCTVIENYYSLARDLSGKNTKITGVIPVAGVVVHS